jgi:hypothetical protein
MNNMREHIYVAGVNSYGQLMNERKRGVVRTFKI